MSWANCRKAALARDQYQCRLCQGEEDLTVHHILPQSLGGGNALYNLVTLCEDCHHSLCDLCTRPRWARVSVTAKVLPFEMLMKKNSYVLNWGY